MIAATEAVQDKNSQDEERQGACLMQKRNGYSDVGGHHYYSECYLD